MFLGVMNMEFILKDSKCQCGGKIIVLNYEDCVDYGLCSDCLKKYPLPAENFREFVKKYCIYMKEGNVMRKVLECSTDGDKRFSALVAKIDVNGKTDTIENHYQKSKVFKSEDGKLTQYTNWKDAKGKKPVAFNISGYILPLRFGEMFYNLLWYKYLKKNKSLENVLMQYDDYKDKYKSKTAHVCQADTIRLYMNDENNDKYSDEQRGSKLYESCLQLINILNGKNTTIIEEGDIFKGYSQIIGHQVNAQGVMKSGVANTLRELYPKAYDEYIKMPLMKDRKIMGTCQIVNIENKYIANLFGQFNYGRNPNVIYTDKDKLKEALLQLKKFAKKNKLVVSIPYKIGCGLGNENWDKVVYPLIKEVFKDYYVILYRYNA